MSTGGRSARATEFSAAAWDGGTPGVLAAWGAPAAAVVPMYAAATAASDRTCAGVPRTSTLPSSSTVTLSHAAVTTSRTCSTSRIPSTWERREATSVMSSSTSGSLSPAPISSSRSIRGSRARARANSRRLRESSGRSRVWRPAASASPVRARISRLVAMARCRVRTRAPLCWARSRFSSTVSCGKVRGTWWVRPMPSRARLAASSPVMSPPSIAPTAPKRLVSLATSRSAPRRGGEPGGLLTACTPRPDPRGRRHRGAPDATRGEPDDEDQDHTGDRVVDVGIGGEDLDKHDGEHGAYPRADPGGHPADDHHGDDVDRPLQRKRAARLDIGRVQRLERARGTHDERGKHDRHELRTEGVDAHLLSHILIVADGPQRERQATAQQPYDDRGGQRGTSEPPPVQPEVGGNRAAQEQAGRSAEGADRRDEQQQRLGKRQGRDAEVHAAQPENGPAYGGREDHGDRASGDDGGDKRKPVAGQLGKGVRARPDERGRPERHHAAVARDEVPRLADRHVQQD